MIARSRFDQVVGKIGLLTVILTGCTSPRVVSDRAVVPDPEIGKLGIVALVTAVRGKEGGGHCNAVAISPTILLTAAHCCAADKITVFPWSTKNIGAWQDAVQVARGCATLTPLDRESGTMPDRGKDLGLVALNKPLPKEIVPVRLLPTGAAINAPSVKFAGRENLLESDVKDSGAGATIAQFLSPPRALFKPLQSRLGIASVVTDEGIVVFSAVPKGIVDDGTSGAGVFYEVNGQLYLMGILAGSWKAGKFPFVVDVRNNKAWIEEMTRAALQ